MKKPKASIRGESFTKEEMKEAIAMLDDEIIKREEDIRQQTELLCTSLRAKAKAQIEAMPFAIHSLTLKEYCETYRGSTQYFLEQQQQQQQKEKQQQPTSPPPTKRTSNTKKRILHIDEGEERRESLNSTKKRPKAAPVPEKRIEKEEEKSPLKSPITPTMEPPKSPITPTIEPPKLSAIIKKPDPPLPPPPPPPPKKNKKLDFGPLFIHMERPSHPKMSLRLDPGHTIDKLGQFTITAPTEILKQLDDDQKGRVRDQIQSLQDQLDELKRSL